LQKTAMPATSSSVLPIRIGYEASLTATASGNTWIPKSLTYTSNTTHRVVTLT
jgi:hypothetical protein